MRFRTGETFVYSVGDVCGEGIVCDLARVMRAFRSGTVRVLQNVPSSWRDWLEKTIVDLVGCSSGSDFYQLLAHLSDLHLRP
jgi:hypothetical protein